MTHYQVKKYRSQGGITANDLAEAKEEKKMTRDIMQKAK
jgi:hypothetical protein